MASYSELRQVWYLEARTKFYRAAVFEINGLWYAVFNWGGGKATGDIGWSRGQMQSFAFPTHGEAAEACRSKVIAKSNKEYTDLNAWTSKVAQAGPAPQTILDHVRVMHGMPPIAKNAPRPKIPKVSQKITITTSTGALKPALAKRVKWSAQE